MSERYLFTFRHMSRLVTFGPHENAQAAKESFQFRYGYWPELHSVDPWIPKETGE